MSLEKLKKIISEKSKDLSTQKSPIPSEEPGRDSQSLGRDSECGLNGPRKKKTSFKEVKKDSRFQRGEPEASPAIGSQDKNSKIENSPQKAQKTPARTHRARAKESPEEFGEKLEKLRREEPAIRPVVRAVRRLADCITEDSADVNARVLAEAKQATHRYFDPGSKTMIEVPDHKTRLAAVTLELAYVEGTPVKREISLTGTFESAEAVLERLRQSPEAMRMFGNLGVQKPPCEIEAEITRESVPEK
jgi:hypothetical protein